jgi:hypothetical protein
MQIPLTSSLIREEFLHNPFNISNKAGGCTRLQAKFNSFLIFWPIFLIQSNYKINCEFYFQNNGSLTSVNLSWNGFGYEGCSALSEALANNTALKELNLACNRVHPPALLELLKGLCKNSSLIRLDVSGICIFYFFLHINI